MKPSLSILCLLIMLCGCTKKSPPPSDRKKPAPVRKARIGLDRGQPELVKGVRALMDNCEFSVIGQARRCKNHEDQALRKLELELGIKTAMMTYCHGLSDPQEKVRSAVAAQIQRLAGPRPMRENADAKVLSCLLAVVGKTVDFKVGRSAARAAVSMAPVLDRLTETLKVLDSSKTHAIRAAGYGALWANGRLGALDRLAQVIREDDNMMVRIAAINGFLMGDPHNEEELKKICELLFSQLTVDPIKVAAAAARRTVALCPDRNEQVLKAAEHLFKRGLLESGYISALRVVASPRGRKVAAGHKQRVMRIFNRVLADQKAEEITRGAALRSIAHLDGKAGARLAQRYAKSDTRYLRKVAERILNAESRDKRRLHERKSSRKSSRKSAR